MDVAAAAAAVVGMPGVDRERLRARSRGLGVGEELSEAGAGLMVLLTGLALKVTLRGALGRAVSCRRSGDRSPVCVGFMLCGGLWMLAAKMRLYDYCARSVLVM